jgi:Calcineurin-like phosphoesterase
MTRNCFDIIGDVHGCSGELKVLLQILGYDSAGMENAAHSEERTLVFLGDLVNRGPDTPGVLRHAMNMVESGFALCVLGNHDEKLLRYLKGETEPGVELTASLMQLRDESEDFRKTIIQFLESAPTQIALDKGKLIVAHAGIKESLQGVDSPEAREFALSGELTGDIDEQGNPIRYNWAADYRGKAYVVYGHSPVREPVWLNRTICIDTGCVYGGKLTALRYPEMALVSVPAARVYYKRKKPIV